jgi:hypothetical protein
MLSTPCGQILFRACSPATFSGRWAEVGDGFSLPTISHYHRFRFLEKKIPIMSQTSAEATPASLVIPASCKPPAEHPGGVVPGRPGMHGSITGSSPGTCIEGRRPQIFAEGAAWMPGSVPGSSPRGITAAAEAARPGNFWASPKRARRLESRRKDRDRRRRRCGPT